VDLNRNFDVGWEGLQDAGRPSSEGYKGPAPESEPETAAILKAAADCGACLAVSYHSTGRILYWDYGAEGALGERQRALMELLRGLTGYAPQPAARPEESAAGFSDYFVQRLGLPAATIENGKGACPLGIGELPAIWRANCELLPALASFALEAADV